MTVIDEHELNYSAWIKVADGQIRLMVTFEGFDDELSAQEFLEELLGSNESKVVH
tara:strand:+ start:98 stop:262 length:165 start_codon:yes stop_codon:yes gene_type:complete